MSKAVYVETNHSRRADALYCEDCKKFIVGRMFSHYHVQHFPEHRITWLILEVA